MSTQLAARGVQSTVTTTESMPASGTLTLRAVVPERRVQWETAVVDNEHMGKRSSKSECLLVHCTYCLLVRQNNCYAECCIFHKTRKFDESSSDESSSSEEDEEPLVDIIEK
jgi:protein phosphatase 1 regulatory subunit 11